MAGLEENYYFVPLALGKKRKQDKEGREEVRKILILNSSASFQNI